MLTILVPTDYSPEAKNALRYAVEFAAQTGSELVLYHAIPEVMPISEIPYENYYSDELDEENLLIESFKNQAELENFPSIRSPRAVVNFSNRVDDGICAAADEVKADLIILGTHGASGWKKYLLGSNASNLIARAKQPVIAIPSNYRFSPIYHIVYASDLKNLDAELNILVPFSKVFQSVLEIFYFDYAGAESEKMMLDAEKYIEAHQYRNIRLSIKKGILEKSLDEQLAQALNPGNTQILAMFRSNHGWFDNLLTSSISEKMVMKCSIPVMVLKKEEV
ncbi:MAG: universal stress protein [Bacteroidetes bacterium]|nr:universal stress protein [Bacteroidota bacterium]